MQRVPAVCVFIEFEHREINHPQRTPGFFEQAVFATKIAMTNFDAQRADRIVDDFGFVGAEENQITILRTGALKDPRQCSIMNILDDR